MGNAAAAQLIHEISHRETFPDVVAGIELAAGIQRVSALSRSRQRLGGISAVMTRSLGATTLDDMLVGDIESVRDLRKPDELRLRNPHALIGDQRRQRVGALCCRNRISLITPGQASASTQMFMPQQLTLIDLPD